MTTPEPFYADDGLNAETYDARTPDALAASGIADDVAFYVATAAETGGPVLELGSGTGRVAWELAKAGHETVGVDLSDPMIRLAERKRTDHPEEISARVSFVRANMAELDLDRRFRLAVIPFRAFQQLTDPADQRRCLEAVHRHLEPGGRLVVDLFDPRLDWITPGGARPPIPHEPFRHPVTGNEVRVVAGDRTLDVLAQTFTETWVFTEVDATGAVVREMRERLEMRWTYRYEMRYLLELAGFGEIEERGDFRGGPPAYGAEQVWIATRPA